MTTEAAEAFAERMKSDEAFRDQLVGAATLEDGLQMANDAGYAIGPEDLDAIRSAMGVAELSDADLDNVAGGTDTLTASGPMTWWGPPR
jgi:predicted ribosomally synthesized peptide with nif11-like leader